MSRVRDFNADEIEAFAIEYRRGEHEGASDLEVMTRAAQWRSIDWGTGAYGIATFVQLGQGATR